MLVYQRLAHLLNARENCRKSGNSEWRKIHGQRIDDIIQNAPSGSGIDSGTQLGDESTDEKLVFVTAYHHMNEGGMYDGWTEHVIRVKPCLVFGFQMKIGGRDRNNIKDYLYEVFDQWLREECEEESK